ncbi:MAG: protease [Cellvibrio sp.]|nr:protease [Cellvibrio sp.]
MKPVYFSYALLACICQPGYAQLLNSDVPGPDVLNNDLLDTGLVGQQLDTIARDLDDVVGQARTNLEREALDPLSRPVTALVDTLPLDALANVLPILTRTGETAFVDVAVENGARAVEREWLIMLDTAELAVLQPLNAEIIEQTAFAGLDMALVRFRVASEWDSLAALKKALPAHLHNQLDRNHIYAAQAVNTSATATAPELRPICDDNVKIGMIDTAINNNHPAFSKSRIIVRDFLGEKFAAPVAHGTAVAGLLVGADVHFQPLLPKASLYAASVFYPRNQYAQGATMIDLVRALNWLVGEKVSVINMSLAGPDNQILHRVIAKVLHAGTAVVAAAGNEGPAAPPLYPAAYPDVIAVTAVDREQRIYRWANRGDHIDFAALGVSVTTARSSGDFGRETGTSIAAPIVSAFVACELVHRITPSDLLERLTAKAIDVGEQGRDPVFGVGVLDVIQKRALNISDANVSE